MLSKAGPPPPRSLNNVRNALVGTSLYVVSTEDIHRTTKEIPPAITDPCGVPRLSIARSHLHLGLSMRSNTADAPTLDGAR